MSTHRTPVTPPSAGIYPLVAFIALPVDFALARIDPSTGFNAPPVAIIACAALIPVCALIQRRTFGDPFSLGLAKGLAVACFTVLPTVLLSILTAAWAVLGALDLAAWRARAGSVSQVPGITARMPALDGAVADDEASRSLAELDPWLNHHPLPERD